MKNFEKIKLENGLRIILAPDPRSLAVTVLIIVAAGSKYETKEKSGLSHFLEHMCFKGTINRPRAIDISSEFDRIGAQYNAFTSSEYTGYFAKAQPKYVSRIMEVVSDIYLNSVYDEKEIEKEKGVIIEEINAYEDLPARNVHDVFNSLLYGDHPAGWNVAGTKKTVAKIEHRDLLKYHDRNYLASSTVVVVAGNFKKEKALKDIGSFFGKIKKGLKQDIARTVEKQSAPAVLVKNKKTDQSHMVLGARAFGYFDERRYALQVLSDILGGGMSSRLFQRIRNEMGAAYYVYADTDLSFDHGYLSVSVGAKNQMAEEIIKIILEEFRRSKSESVSGVELQTSKDHLVGNFMLDLETSDELAGFYGGQEITRKKICFPEETVKKIQKVSSKDVLAVAASIFRDEKLNLAIIGPFKNKARFERILKI